MTRTAMMTVNAATGLLPAIAAAGGDPDAVLRAARLDRATLERVDALIPSSAFARLLDQAARSTGDECFGLHFGERFDARDLGLLAYVVLNSPTVAAAMYNIGRYVHLHNSGLRMSFGTEGRRACLRYRVSDGPQHEVRQQNEYSMAVLWLTLRGITEGDWAPAAVEFAHDTPGPCRYERVFGCAARFSCPSNALVLEHDFVERRVRAADHKLYRALRRQFDRLLARFPRRDDMLDTVRRAIGESLESGDARLESVAAKLATSPRTLERRLKEHGISYRELVSETRRHYAVGYLQDAKHTVTEIAFRLGYSEVSAFNRAFKRWTGGTPVAYRQSALARAAGERAPELTRPAAAP
ncbi:MAG TPA: AraC family transcriptional regulator [Burkholderiales bacterium]|nr:AraC family transcriptional regulator [Burkholderiales bacterium]